MEPEEETSVEQLELETEGPQELDIYRDYDEDLLIGVQRTQAVALTAIVCVSFLGNIFVLCSLCGPRYSARPSRRIMKQLLCHLCIGDLAYAILTILPRTINILTFPRFYGGYVVCRMVKFLQLVPVYVCPFLTVACTVERYSSLRRNKDDLDPMALANRRRISWRESRSFAHVLSFWAWLSAMVLSAPNILAFRYEYLDDAGTVGACVYQVREAYERLWMTFLTCATWLVPLLLIAALTTIALSRYYMKRRRRKRSAAVGEVRENVDETEDVRLMRFFALLILAKYILWTPFNVTNIVGSYWRATMIDETLSVTVTLASNCSCCVPVIAYVIYECKYLRRYLSGFSRRTQCIGQPASVSATETGDTHSVATTDAIRKSVVSVSVQPPQEDLLSQHPSSDDTPIVVFNV